MPTMATARRKGRPVKLLNPRALLLAAALATAAIGPLPTRAAPATQPSAEHVIRVAIYTDGGAPDVDRPGQIPSGPTNVTNCLSKLAPGRYQITRLKGADIRSGALDGFDVAVFPGGSGSGQARSLQAEGRARVRQFVEHGGGYLGICGGAYLGTSCYPWSLNIVNARTIDREHWARGSPSDVKLELTPLGQKQLDTPKPEVTCLYHQGPLLGPDHYKGLPAYQTLATFGSEVTQHAPKGVMIGTTAVTQSLFGRGHVILISPHPEKSPGLDGFIRRSVDWLGQGPAAESATAPGVGDVATPDAVDKPTTAPAVSAAR